MDRYSELNTHYHYYLKTPPEIDRLDIKHYQKVYENYIEFLTQDFSEQDWYKFYRGLGNFIVKINNDFRKTRLGHYILYNYNQERIEYLKNIKHLSF